VRCGPALSASNRRRNTVAAYLRLRGYADDHEQSFRRHGRDQWHGRRHDAIRTKRAGRLFSQDNHGTGVATRSSDGGAHSSDGYATKELELTEGPKNWLDLRSHSHGEYWLRKQRHFHVDLDPIAQTFTGTVSTQLANGAAINYAARTSGSSIVTEAERGLPIEEVVARTKPSVVFLKVLAKSGSGFFVTDTGVIATNAHLAREEETLRHRAGEGGRQRVFAANAGRRFDGAAGTKRSGDRKSG